MTRTDAATFLQDALHIAEQGVPVFPALDKKPRSGIRWKDEATTDVVTIMGWWERWPDSEVGVPMPAGTMAVDIDDLPAVRQAVTDGILEDFAETKGQQTRSGGFHLFYVTDGRLVQQTVKRGGIGLDTRVGGKGYVIAYDADAFDVAQWSPAPEWVYDAPERGPKAEPVSAEAPLGTNDDIFRYLVSLPALPEADLLALMRAMLADGRVVSLDAKDPWTDRAFVTLADSVASRSRLPVGWDEYIVGFVERLNAAAAIVRKDPAAAAALKHGRELVLTSASAIVPRRTRWLWDRRLALGSVSLIGGREGQGKTLLAIETAARITQGELPGEFFGNPKNVLFVTTEDDWEQTLAPRLMAARADLNRILRAEVRTADDIMTGLSLPHDNAALERAITQHGVAYIVLDPLLSRLDGGLDSHKDAEVRQALEPLVSMAQRTRTHVAGLIHVNKSETTDPLTSIMASRAFVAVARAVLFVMRDPEDDSARLVGQAKNNLGSKDLPVLRFTVDTAIVGEDPEDGQPIETGQLRWLSDSNVSIEDSLLALTTKPKAGSKRSEAEDWLVRYLQACEDFAAPASEVREAAGRAQPEVSSDSLRRAKEGLERAGKLSWHKTDTMPAVVVWSLSAAAGLVA